MKTRLHFFIGLFLSVCAINAQQSYNGKPRYQILTTQNSATLGIITIELFQNIAPYHVRNFDSLVSKNFYDTTAFHRVVPGFVIQGGDPNSRSGPVNTWGFGQAGQPTVKAEFSVAKHERGILSAARSSNINSATSQFFICVAPAPNLNGQYSVYGRVTSGMSFVDQIVTSPTVTGTQRPVNKVEMFIKYIGLNDTVPQPPVLIQPANASIDIDTIITQLKWNAVSDGIIYRLDIARDSLFTDTLKSVDLTTLSYNATYLPAKTKCYWKVKVNNGGFFTNSEIRHFTTKGIVEVPNTTAITELSAKSKIGIYPNPAQEQITVSGLRKGQTLLITDVSGKTIRRIEVQDILHTIDCRDIPRGHYFYSVSEQNQTIFSAAFELQ